jgi:uncharacterized membrane protein
MFSPFIFWPWFTGLIFLAGGLFVFRRRIADASGVEKIVASGPVLYAVPLAVFGAEHLSGPRILMRIVPDWIPAHLFWAYLVGIALLCAAVSIVAMRYVTLSGSLLGLMFFLFVLFIHAPRVAANPGDRISWAVALRDLAFGGAAWALAGSQSRRPTYALAGTGRFIVALSAIFFGIEHFLHPNHAPGVPLPKMMPPWIPLGIVWSCLTGAALLATGITLLLRKNGRMVSAWTGLLVTLLVLFVYAPMLPIASKPPEMTEAINYIADTLLFAGALLVVARSLQRKKPPLHAV